MQAVAVAGRVAVAVGLALAQVVRVAAAKEAMPLHQQRVQLTQAAAVGVDFTTQLRVHPVVQA
jgi:hypothetical protein